VTRNEAAERLRLYTQSMTPEMFALLDDALAAERRATVDEVLSGLRSEDQTDQVLAIIAQVEAMKEAAR